jgi:hypothetical protein
MSMLNSSLVQLQITGLSIQRLHAMGLTPLERIAFARQYEIPGWLSEGALDLVLSEDAAAVEEVAGVLGWETAARVYACRADALTVALRKENQRNVEHSARVPRLKPNRKGRLSEGVEMGRGLADMMRDAYPALYLSVSEIFDSEITRPTRN